MHDVPRLLLARCCNAVVVLAIVSVCVGEGGAEKAKRWETDYKKKG